MAEIDQSTRHGEEAQGASAIFPYDRMTVQHFRENFPRARWDDARKAWFIPGKTASRRFERWLERENATRSVHADARGKDAFRFDPIHSPYLQVRDDGLAVTTPFSRTVVSLLREIPFAAWDPDQRAWIVPFRSYDDLRKRWERIEEAARRNEPEQKRARARERLASADEQTRLRAAERRRRRHPLDPHHLPPLERPVMTRLHGIVVFTHSDGELAEPEVLQGAYPELDQVREYVWGYWRPAGFEELVRTWPAKTAPPDNDALWWQPSIEELRPVRKTARSREGRRSQAPPA